MVVMEAMACKDMTARNRDSPPESPNIGRARAGETGVAKQDGGQGSPSHPKHKGYHMPCTVPDHLYSFPGQWPLKFLE